MGHKFSKVVFALSLVAIVVPLVSRVNDLNQITPNPVTAPVMVADGNPGPPLPPPTVFGVQAVAEPIIIADGNPGPPLPPPTVFGMQTVAEPVIIADGNPGPPLPPPTSKAAQIGSEYAV